MECLAAKDESDQDQIQELLNVCKGKTPEQVKLIFEEWSYYLNFVGKRNAIEDALDSIYSDGEVDYERVRYLVESDRDGRCVVYEPGYPVVSQYYYDKENGLYIREVSGVVSRKEYEDAIEISKDNK